MLYFTKVNDLRLYTPKTSSEGQVLFIYLFIVIFSSSLLKSFQSWFLFRQIDTFSTGM